MAIADVAAWAEMWRIGQKRMMDLYEKEFLEPMRRTFARSPGGHLLELSEVHGTLFCVRCVSLVPELLARDICPAAAKESDGRVANEPEQPRV